MDKKEGCRSGSIRIRNECIQVPEGWWPVGKGELIRKTGLDTEGCTLDIRTKAKPDGTTESHIIRRCPSTTRILRTLGTHTDFESGLHAALQWIKKQKNTEMG